MSFQLGDEETYYEVRRRNTQPSRDGKISADRKVVSGPKVDTVPVQNHPKQEMINKDTIEHLKNKLLMKDNTIKKQQENIHDLQNTLKKYQNDLNDLHLKTKKTKMELEDFKLQCIEQGHENIPNKSKQDEAVLVTSEVQTQHFLLPEFSGDHGGCIVQYLNKDEDEFRTLNDLIEQINELSDILKARESKITVQDVMISNLQKKVKASHVEVVMIKEKCEKYLQDIQKTEQNQAGCERRIKELNDVLERSYTDLQDSLNSMDIGENTTCILCDQNMKNFRQRYDESQETFKNLKAEFSYLLFNLKSHEKQVTYHGGMIDSLNEVLQRNQCDLEDILSKTSVFSKEKRAFHVDHEECEQKIERLEKSLKHFQEERQKWYSKLESLAENKTAEVLQEEHESLKAEIEKLQNNLISREKVAANQEQIINILQDSVNIAQKEQQDFQQKLKDAEAEKEMLLNALQEEQRKAVNLQEALLATKQQLEDLQGNKYELIIKDRIIRFLRLDLSEIKSQYRNCYGEVVKQEKVLDTLRDSSDDLKTEIVNLEQDICLLELHLAEKLKVLCFIKDHVKEMEAELSDRDRIIKDQVNHILELNNKIQDQMNEIQEFKNKIRDKNNILQDQINEIQLLNSNIQGQSIKLIDQRNQLDDESNKIQELNGKLQVQCKKLEDQACKIQELTTEIQDLSRENNDLVIKTKELEVEGIYWRSVKEESEEMLLEQKQLTIKNKMIQSLQDNMNEINHIAVQRLEGKEKLIQNLQSHISRLQIQLKYENQKATPFEEVNTLQKEAERLKSENKQLLLLQDRLKAEVREYMSVPETWWWDDFWQI
ncbi:uncharacterized protein LOC110841264 isoform X2 [Zootermopsis nevadensis]|nr:uncharacterized protein LOC110841264 isoform X2 [Zootermopsis nevadensis]